MQITELIAKLEEALAKHGDLSVQVLLLATERGGNVLHWDLETFIRIMLYLLGLLLFANRNPMLPDWAKWLFLVGYAALLSCSVTSDEDN